MRRIFTIVMIFAAIAGYAQKKKKGQDTTTPAAQTTTPAPTATPAAVAPAKSDTIQQIDFIINHFLKKYSLATRWNDPIVAKDALYDLIAETGSDSLAYTLAIYYYDNQQYASSALLSKDLLARTPKATNLLQLSAESFEALGIREKALPAYESLYLLTSNTAVLYKMITLEYESKLYPECKANIDILLSKTDLDSLKVTLNDPTTNKPVEYPIRVSVLNVKGLVAEQQGDKAAARKAYQDALALAPTFKPAKDNLAKLK